MSRQAFYSVTNVATSKMADVASGRVRSHRLGGILRWVGGSLAGLIAFVAIFAVVHGFTRNFDYHALIQALRQLQKPVIVWSVGATALSFAALVARDLCALRYAGARPPVSAILLAGFCGSALGNAVGVGTLTGGAVRYRIYGAARVAPDDIGRVMVFIASGFSLGLAGFTAFVVLIDAAPTAHLLGWPVVIFRAAAIAVLASTFTLVLLCRRGVVRLARFTAMPSPGLLVTQLALTAIDLLAAAAALWVLLPGPQIDFGSFAAIFATATAIGVASRVPGGIGIFEAVMFFALGRRVSPPAVAAALLAYRGIYFGLPLILSAVLIAAFELRPMAGARSAVGRRLARSVARLSPSFIGVITFAVGIILVFSGATPTFAHRLAILSVRLPLWVVEAAHFLGSLVGVLLLFLARGLFHRLDDAWWLVLGLSVTSLGLSLAKGLAYGEAVILMLLILLLIATRRQFGRSASLLGQPFTGEWFVAVAVIIGAAFWILLFSFQDVRYTRDLWWQFEFDAQAPRALRATVGVAVLAMSLALLQLLRPPKGSAARPTAQTLSKAAAIIRLQKHTSAMLALMGDKSLMFSASGNAFLSFARFGRSWIALFDPIGPRAEWSELIWRFVEHAYSHGGRAAFYQVRSESLPLYLDAGLQIMKLGEEAVVPLVGFDLAAAKCARLRYALSRGEREGLSVELLEPAQVPRIMDVIQALSDDWLESHRIDERGFSVAAFERTYIAAQWVALLRQHGRPIAFTTVMVTELRHEATIGLMRHGRESSPYGMEFLFTKLLLAFKEAGYERFSLGMVPLSGFQPTPLSSPWHRLGALIWQHGNRLYNFQGLKLFKAKFNPAWEPRYLAASGTIGPFVALADVASDGRGRREPRSFRRLKCLALFLACLFFAMPSRALDGGRYGEVHLVAPQGQMRGLVIFFADHGGWTSRDQTIINALASKGALAVGVDTDTYLAKIAPGNVDCDQLVGDAEALSRLLQRQHGDIEYQFPILAGVGKGGTLAGVILAQAPVNTLAGAVSLDPSRSVATSRPLCAGRPMVQDASEGFVYGPVHSLGGFWIVGLTPSAPPSGRAHVGDLRKAGMPVDIRDLSDTRLDDAIASLIGPHLYQGSPGGIAALPLVELPAAKPSPLTAVVISGDGGWRDLDKTIAEDLQKDGVSVVGWDSVRYFWHQKTPERTAADLAAVLDTYGKRWGASKVALIGYSFGADILPFAYNRLPKRLQDRVRLISLLGFTSAADWEISVRGWLGEPPSENATPVEPEIARIPPALLQCFYGQDETDSACPSLVSRGAQIVHTTGGHHFDGDYGALEKHILEAFRQRLGS